MKNNKPIHVRFPDSVAIEILKQAEKEDITFSEMLRRIVSIWLKKLAAKI